MKSPMTNQPLLPVWRTRVAWLAVTAATMLSMLPAVGQSTFTRITTGPIATEGKYSNRGTWVDYDNDGDLDLFVANGGYDWPLPAKANYLYRNDGSGTFTKITSGAVVEDVEQSHSGAWGDYDNDGHIDLFVSNLGAEEDWSLYRNSLYRNLGDGTFMKITNTPLDKDGGYHSAGSWADYDSDGHLDLLAVSWGGPRLLYHNNGDATFTRITEGTVVTNETAAVGAVWADYDGDGDQDLLVLNGEGGNQAPPRRNSFYRNEGGGTFTPITTGPFFEEESPHFINAVCGDYDNDGDLDVYVCYGWTGGSNFLFQNNGDGTFSKITGGVELSTGAMAAAWGDYDNDGFLDLFLARGMVGNQLYHNSGDGTFTQIATGPGADTGYLSLGCDWGDYDNDGFLDLFVANGNAFKAQSQWMNNFLYHNDGNTNRWLKVKLVGTVSNRAAIGAKVRVLASLGGTNRWQLREISVGCNCSGHNLLPHFGLRDALKADLVRIEWPSGIVQELRDVPANQTLTVTEPARLQMPQPGQLHIQCWKGMVFGIETSSNLLTWTPLATVTNLNLMGGVQWTDAEAPGPATRFYRAVKQ